MRCGFSHLFRMYIPPHRPRRRHGQWLSSWACWPAATRKQCASGYPTRSCLISDEASRNRRSAFQLRPVNASVSPWWTPAEKCRLFQATRNPPPAASCSASRHGTTDRRASMKHSLNKRFASKISCSDSTKCYAGVSLKDPVRQGRHRGFLACQLTETYLQLTLNAVGGAKNSTSLGLTL